MSTELEFCMKLHTNILFHNSRIKIHYNIRISNFSDLERQDKSDMLRVICNQWPMLLLEIRFI